MFVIEGKKILEHDVTIEILGNVVGLLYLQCRTGGEMRKKGLESHC